MRNRIKLQFITSLCLALGCASNAGQETQPIVPVDSAQPDALTDSASQIPDGAQALEIDARITTGKLSNGLTYYVLPHSKPQKRAQLWLAVNAGSVLEEDDQLGLAHMVEHMAFNGTTNFKKMAIVNYLESIGMQFGADVNAYTSFDETVYMLQLPTDDASAVQTGMSILRDWAGRVAFEPEEVEKERGVVLEEWRLGRGAYKRVLDKQFPILFKGSRYAQRLPIGSDKIIANAPREALTRFYNDWYRPDLMAVVAVGDFDPAVMEAQIKERFGDLKSPSNPKPRPQVDVPSHPTTLVSIETDAELPQTMVQIYNKMPSRSHSTIGDYRRTLVESLYHKMLNDRFREISQTPDSPFTFAFSQTSQNVRTSDAYIRIAAAREGQLEATVARLFEEVIRVERHGFTPGELERAKKEVLRDYESSVAERDKTNARAFAGEMVRNFLTGESMPGIEKEFELANRFVPDVTVDELNTLARNWGGEADRVVMISGPDGMDKPSEKQVLAWVNDVGQKTIAAYDDGDVATTLMANKPTPGKIVSEKHIEMLGVTEWTLSNGAKVVVKPTDFKNDEILFSAYSPGGHSLVDDSDFVNASFASGIVGRSGVGDINNIELGKALAGKMLSVYSYIGELEEGLGGYSSPQDLETMMQLLHLKVTKPRIDTTAFEAWKVDALESSKNRRVRPEGAFREDFQAFRTKNHFRTRPTTPEVINSVDPNKALAIYRDRFADVGDFTFLFVGNIDIAQLRGYTEQYLASLPSAGREESWKDTGVRMPKGVKRKVFHHGSEPKSRVELTFHHPTKWSSKGNNDAHMLSEVLQIRLREVLREDMSGVYGVSVWSQLKRRPNQESFLSISFGCSPENVDKLTKGVFSVIKEIKKKGVEKEYLDKVKQARVRERELDLKKNRFWLRKLEWAYTFGDDPTKIVTEFESKVDAISSERVKKSARKNASDRQYLLGVLKPEKSIAKQ